VRARIVLLGILITLLPTASAQDEIPDLCVVRFAPSVSFDVVNVAADLQTTPAGINSTARQADEDGDGNLTKAEADYYQVESRYERTDGPKLGNKRLRLDGNDASRVIIWTQLKGFEGPVEGTPGVARVITEHRAYFFSPENRPSHVIDGGYPDPTPVVVEEFVVVDAPLGWLVFAVNSTIKERVQVTLPAFGTQQAFNFTFARPGYNPWTDTFVTPAATPGPTPLALMMLVFACATMLRRRA
jgi:hypothetical protein